MNTQIPNSSGAGKALTDYNPDAARQVLLQLKDDLAGRSGVLRLVRGAKERDMRFETRSWWRFWGRRDSKMEATMDGLEKLFSRAYRKSIEEMQPSAERNRLATEYNTIIKDFRRVAQRKWNRIGKTTVADFVGRFERIKNLPNIPQLRNLKTGRECDVLKRKMTAMQEIAIRHQATLSSNFSEHWLGAGNVGFKTVYEEPKLLGDGINNNRKIQRIRARVAELYAPLAEARLEKLLAEGLPNDEADVIRAADLQFMRNTQDGIIALVTAPRSTNQHKITHEASLFIADCRAKGFSAEEAMDIARSGKYFREVPAVQIENIVAKLKVGTALSQSEEANLRLFFPLASS